MHPRRRQVCAAGVWALAVALPFAARAQSATDLGSRMRVDGDAGDFTASETVFRTPALCSSLALGCTTDEEPTAEGNCTALQDVRQAYVTWDASRLYIAIEARAAGGACIVWLDFLPGGLAEASGLVAWRRAVRFGGDFRPDAFLAVHDGAHAPELWRVEGDEGTTRVPSDSLAARSSLDVDASGRGLEAAIPWRTLFPDATSPAWLPPGASRERGLRFAAAVIGSEAGSGACDLAPDPTSPASATLPAFVDRWVRVDWDADRDGVPNLGAAVQTQTAPRFEPVDAVASQGVRLQALHCFTRGQPSVLVLAEAGLAFTFAFEVTEPAPPEIFMSAILYSVQGTRARTLFQDAHRVRTTPVAPYGPFGDPAADRWDGRDDAGRPVPGGTYVLRLTAGPTAGTPTSQVQRTVTVVR